MAEWKRIQLVTTRTQLQCLASLNGVKGHGVAVRCGIGCRCSSDPKLLWCRLAAALIQPLALEPPYASGATLKRKKIKIKVKNVFINISTYICYMCIKSSIGSVSLENPNTVSLGKEEISNVFSVRERFGPGT